MIVGVKNPAKLSNIEADADFDALTYKITAAELVTDSLVSETSANVLPLSLYRVPSLSNNLRCSHDAEQTVACIASERFKGFADALTLPSWLARYGRIRFKFDVKGPDTTGNVYVIRRPSDTGVWTYSAEMVMSTHSLTANYVTQTYDWPLATPLPRALGLIGDGAGGTRTIYVRNIRAYFDHTAVTTIYD